MVNNEQRDVKVWQPDIKWENRDDGTILIWQDGPLAEYPDRLSDRIAHWVKVKPDHIWMAERGADGSWDSVTYAELMAHMQKIGQYLLDLDLSVERPLMILSDNSIAHGIMALSAQYVGVASAAIAPAYSLLSKDHGKLKDVTGQITPGAVFAMDVTPFADAIAAVFDEDLPILAVSGDIPTNSVSLWADYCNTTPTGAVQAANAATGPDTVAKFMFTSGTTGSPKAVIQTQRMLCSNMEMVVDCYAFMREFPPTIVDWAPWNHVASGNKVFNMALYNGGSFYIDSGKPTPAGMKETIRNLREISPTWYFNVPAGYEMLIEAMEDDPALRENFFKNMQMLLYAGAGMASHTWDTLNAMAVEATGHRILLGTGLGSTETAPFAMYCTMEQDGPGNIGVPSREIIVKLVPSGDKLEVRFKGPNITPGYWRSPDLTKAAFDDEGFYCIGDALRYADPDDPAKGFFFDGRTAENFKLMTGTWVAVGTLRAKLVDALGGLIRDAVITGEGRYELGALLVPFRPSIERLVPNSADLSDAELFNHVDVRDELASLLGKHMEKATGSSSRIKRTMILVDPLQMDKGEITDKGSVNQKAVLRHRDALVAALYEEDARVILPKISK